jgi:diguanylate cyclase (GGDEF)-like protein
MDESAGTTADAAPAATGLRALFAKTDDPYAGADIALARRFAVAMWAFGTLVVLVMEIFFPPTRVLGDAGWLVAAGGFLTSFAFVGILADKKRAVGFDFLYAAGFVGVALIALTQHGAGGRVAPYHELYMFQLIGAALMHPPRRVLGFLAFVAAAMFAPVLYANATSEPGEITTELLLWTGLSIVMMALMRTIRNQRLELRQEGDEARQLARVDALTGLGNRRAFDEALEAELARSLRAGSPVSLIVADLDGFKEINDRYGHVLGDDCLRQAAATLRGAVRRPDLCFRWGGDEFAILLTGADATVARALALRIENAVERSCSRPGGEPLTITCGDATLEADMTSQDAVARADLALLTLKGRPYASPANTPKV